MRQKIREKREFLYLDQYMTKYDYTCSTIIKKLHVILNIKNEEVIMIYSCRIMVMEAPVKTKITRASLLHLHIVLGLKYHINQ